MEKRKNSISKPHLKDLCKEDKAKVGELIDKLAQEKRLKASLEEKIFSLQHEIQNLQSEKDSIFQEKEKFRSKLEKCMELIKELPKPLNLIKIDVYTQTFTTEDYFSSIPQKDSEYFRSTFDDNLYKTIEKIENEDQPEIDPFLMQMVLDLENSP